MSTLVKNQAYHDVRETPTFGEPLCKKFKHWLTIYISPCLPSQLCKWRPLTPCYSTQQGTHHV